MTSESPAGHDIPTQGERETLLAPEGEWDERWCGHTKADGTRCKAYRVKGKEACAGHLGLGIASDPAGYQAKSAEGRRAQAEERRKRPQDIYTEALNANAARMAERLIKIATDPETSDADALRAIEALNSRVLGKPKEVVEQVTKPEELQRLEEMSDEEFFAAWQRYRQGTVTAA